MTKHDLVELIGDTGNSDTMLYHSVSVRLAEKEPLLQSLLWMLREGVIERRHFQSLLASTMRG